MPIDAAFLGVVYHETRQQLLTEVQEVHKDRAGHGGTKSTRVMKGTRAKKSIKETIAPAAPAPARATQKVSVGGLSPTGSWPGAVSFRMHGTCSWRWEKWQLWQRTWVWVRLLEFGVEKLMVLEERRSRGVEVVVEEEDNGDDDDEEVGSLEWYVSSC